MKLIDALATPLGRAWQSVFGKAPAIPDGGFTWFAGAGWLACPVVVGIALGELSPKRHGEAGLKEEALSRSVLHAWFELA